MDKKEVEQRIEYFFRKRQNDLHTINAMMQMQFHDWDIDTRTIMMSFPVQAWQLNPAKQMHGGMICTALDMAMGCAAYVYSKAVFTPTIQMAVNFVSAMKEDDVLVIESICDHSGSRMGQIRAIAKVNDHVVATANGPYVINT